METQNDIFISYAHIDNQPLVTNTEGWVSQFHHALEVRVDQLLGKKSSIWRDLKLTGNDCFDDTIIDQLPNVSVLVSVLSPRYVHSDWCVRELDEFCLASEESGGLRMGDKARIFKVLKTPVPVPEHPKNIQNVLGYEFFTIDADTGRARELNKVFGGEAERAFWLKLDDLAQDLCQLLLQIDDKGTSPLAMKTSSDAVFLACASVDIKAQHESIKRDLLGQNLRVLPDQALPNNENELRACLKETLAQCRMSVHPIGKSYELVPGLDNCSLMELENELAMERESMGDFTRLVWIPPGLQPEDTRQIQLIEKLRTDPGIHFGGDLLETPLEDLKTQIHEVLSLEVAPEKTTAPASIAPPAPLASGTPPSTQSPPQVIEQSQEDEFKSIYLICDQKDLDNINTLADQLFELGYEVILPAFDGDEADIREDHEDNLCRADAVLIYYANANDLWLRRKLREIRKTTGMDRASPLDIKAILVAPPNSTQKQWLRTHEALVFYQKDEFSPELLDPFLAELRR